MAGAAETKALKDMMPDILKQVGPQQYQFLKTQLGNVDAKGAEADDDDVPNLVGTFEDAGKKKWFIERIERLSEQGSGSASGPSFWWSHVADSL